jgi:hypothetical protein
MPRRRLPLFIMMVSERGNIGTSEALRIQDDRPYRSPLNRWIALSYAAHQQCA